MILDSIYRNKGISSDELIMLLKMFFKIKEVSVSNKQIRDFVKYMISMNDHPLAPHFKKFVSMNELIHQELVPVIENHIDLIKMFKDGQLLTYTFDNQKYQKLFK